MLSRSRAAACIAISSKLSFGLGSQRGGGGREQGQAKKRIMPGICGVRSSGLGQCQPGLKCSNWGLPGVIKRHKAVPVKDLPPPPPAPGSGPRVSCRVFRGPPLTRIRYVSSTFYHDGFSSPHSVDSSAARAPSLYPNNTVYRTCSTFSHHPFFRHGTNITSVSNFLTLVLADADGVRS